MAISDFPNKLFLTPKKCKNKKWIFLQNRRVSKIIKNRGNTLRYEYVGEGGVRRTCGARRITGLLAQTKIAVCCNTTKAASFSFVIIAYTR